MTKLLGIIGSGNIGSTVAQLAVDADIDVVVSNSRGPQSLTDLVERLGPHATAATAQQAAQAGDVVLVAIPFGARDRLPTEALAGRIVIDAMNYYPDRDGHLAELDTAATTSSELLQRALPESPVVKAFNNIDFRRLLTSARPAAAADRSALPIAGDDPAARSTVSDLLDALGYDAVDIGPLSRSWRSEPNTAVYVTPYFSARPPAGTAQEEMYQWFLQAPGTPVPADEVAALVARTERARAGEARSGRA